MRYFIPADKPTVRTALTVATRSPAMEFTTLVHEYAHELLHRADDRPASRDTRELEAEAVAFVVGGAAGSHDTVFVSWVLGGWIGY